MTSTGTAQLTEGVEMVIERPRTIAGRRERVAVADLATFFSRAIPVVVAELSRLGIAPAGPPTAVYRNETGQVFDVTVGFPVEAPVPATDILVVERLPGGRAVRAEHVGPYETLPAAYAALSAWFGERKLAPPELMWEEYLVGPGAVGPADYRTQVVYPLP